MSPTPPPPPNGQPINVEPCAVHISADIKRFENAVTAQIAEGNDILRGVGNKLGTIAETLKDYHASIAKQDSFLRKLTWRSFAIIGSLAAIGGLTAIGLKIFEVLK